MNNAYLSGYKKKNIPELLKAIDNCTSLSQLFALIQHEQIEIQMHAQDGASNLTPRKLTAKDIIGNRDFPLDRLKRSASIMCRLSTAEITARLSMRFAKPKRSASFLRLFRKRTSKFPCTHSRAPLILHLKNWSPSFKSIRSFHHLNALKPR